MKIFNRAVLYQFDLGHRTWIAEQEMKQMTIIDTFAVYFERSNLSIPKEVLKTDSLLAHPRRVRAGSIAHAPLASSFEAV